MAELGIVSRVMTLARSCLTWLPPLVSVPCRLVTVRSPTFHSECVLIALFFAINNVVTLELSSPETTGANCRFPLLLLSKIEHREPSGPGYAALQGFLAVS